ncbi:MAG: polysaccharide deacetylase family protein [Pseudomonadota bacterium]
MLLASGRFARYFGLSILLCVLPGIVTAANHCVVLQYHHFSDTTPAVTSVSPTLFQAHLDYLRDNDYQVLPLEQVVTRLARDQALPDRCVSLSVDDAYDSVYREAFPRVLALGWPLTVFVNTQGVDAGVDAYMTWEQMREMARAGVRFENHSHSHDHLVRRRPGESEAAWRKRVRADVQLAQRRIHEELGQEARLFAYPYGEYDPGVQSIVRDLGLTGFGQQSGPAWAGGDFTALPRFPMAAAYAEMESFRSKVASLPLPLVEALPRDPVVPLDEWRPVLHLTLQPGSYQPGLLRCYANGSPDVSLSWDENLPNRVSVRPARPLSVGRNRYNCTMPSDETGRFHWYSHNWLRRNADGSWYRE